MISLELILLLLHLFGLVLGVGAASVKLILLIMSKSNLEFTAVFCKVTKPLTRLIVLGLILLTATGIGWILLGTPLTSLLIVKMSFVVVIWILGPIIDNVVEPKFKRLAALPDASVSTEFGRIQMHYLALEATATGLFYVIIVMGALL